MNRIQQWEHRYHDKSMSEKSCHSGESLAQANAKSEEIAELRQQVEILEQLRPVWAQGWTDDSLAAQTATAALTTLWALLGATNQTEAVQKLQALTQPTPKRVITEAEATVMEAFDFGQFASDMLCPVLTGGVARGIASRTQAALSEVLTAMYAELYGPKQEQTYSVWRGGQEGDYEDLPASELTDNERLKYGVDK